MRTLSACVQGIGLLGPGLADWGEACAVLSGELPYVRARTVLPSPGILPPPERRRAGRVIKLALAVGTEAVARAAADARTLPSVFSSSGGDGDNCHEICMTLASRERQISPTRFHNSVHNAAAGYWSIAQGCTEASTSVCAGDASFGAGLLEALAQLAGGAPAVLLLTYDADYPPPLYAKRPIPDAFGTALLLTAADAAARGPRLQLTLCDATPASLPNQALESLRCSIPAARSLPLLERLAQQRGGTVVLDYLDNARLALEVQP
jgi:hypothetical protein